MGGLKVGSVHYVGYRNPRDEMIMVFGSFFCFARCSVVFRDGVDYIVNWSYLRQRNVIRAALREGWQKLTLNELKELKIWGYVDPPICMPQKPVRLVNAPIGDLINLEEDRVDLHHITTKVTAETKATCQSSSCNHGHESIAVDSLHGTLIDIRAN